MPPFRPWADLPPDLLCLITDGLDLKPYVSARGVCTGWRRELAPPSPSLLVVPDGGCPSAASLPACRSFDLKPIPSTLWGQRCVGSSNGWLAFSVGGTFRLFHPVTATEIVLPPLVHEVDLFSSVSKLVFAPSPAADDFVAAAICADDRIAYVTAGARRWAVLDPVCLADRDHFVDVVFEAKDKVYCLTLYGDVHVIRLPEGRRQNPIIVDDSSSGQAISTSSPAERGRRRAQQQRRRVPAGSTVVPHLNAPATIQPLLSDQASLPFNPAASFAPLYNRISRFTGSKHLVFCKAILYQVWRNVACTVTLQLPGGGHCRVEENEVFVLRYYPQRRRRPCWEAVTDLGGYSVFVGRNNVVAMHAEGVPGLKGDCVYWIGGRGRDQGMVIDMATRRSAPCLPAAAGVVHHSTVCWYFLSDMGNN